MTDSGLLLLDESETKHALMNYLGYKEKREADSLRSPLMIYYNYVLCLLCRNPTWVTEILVSSVLYGEIAVLCGWVDPKLS